MIVILSPAKNMHVPEGEFAQRLPRGIGKAKQLNRLLRELSPHEWESLLGINPDLAVRAAVDTQAWRPGGTPAALTYNGLVYHYLRADTLTVEQLNYADRHLRILSALYGPLKPLDSIRPYRLELRCGVRPQGRSLYDFWGNDFYDGLDAGAPILNLASDEYGSAVRRRLRPKDLMVDVEFLSYSRGHYKVIVAWAKMARGRMARYVVENRIEDPAQLREFDEVGFRYSPERSHPAKLVFLKGEIG